MVVGDMRAEWAAVEVRAATLAQLPRLAAAITTDEATVRDLTSDELAFRVRSGETIELAQTNDGNVHELLRLPSVAAPVTLVIGEHLEIDGDLLAFSVVVPIIGGATAGELAVCWRAKPADVLAQLSARTGARVVLGDHALALGELRGPSVAINVSVPGVTGLVLEVPAISTPPEFVGELRIAAIAAGLIGIALLVLGIVPRKRASTIASASLDAAPESVPEVIAVAPTATTNSTRLGRYEPMHLLGSGGTSSVFLARSIGDEGFEKRVALKVLRADLSHDDRFREMFLDEARLAARIDHPNVIEIFDLGRHGDELFIAMEHIDGDDLESLLAYQRANERATPLPIALAILRCVCDGLHAAHTTIDGLVHRDVKPANVMISRNGEVKVGDFGIAKASQQMHVSVIGLTMGTVQFMAPEQRMGRAVDARTDVFGVAAIAYELITSTALNLDLARLLKQGLEGWPHLAPIAELRPEAPAQLEPLLLAALAYEPANRPASCAVLERQLAAIMAARNWNIGKRELATWLAGELAVGRVA